MPPPPPDFFFHKAVPKIVPEMPVVNRSIGSGAPNLLYDESLNFEQNKCNEFYTQLNYQLDEYNEAKKAKVRENIQASLEKQGILELLPGTVRGYALRDRKWCKYRLAMLSF